MNKQAKYRCEWCSRWFHEDKLLEVQFAGGPKTIYCRECLDYWRRLQPNIVSVENAVQQPRTGDAAAFPGPDVV
jgi:late competence protein required for DNA uptake (superfamily II DNA/RNA helicase)